MLITDELFQAFLKCETKSYLKSSAAVGSLSESSNWQQHQIEDYKQRCVIQLRSCFREDEYFIGVTSLQNLEGIKPCLVIGCDLQAEGIRSCIHALERLDSPGRTKHSPYIPIRFVPNEKITKLDKLLLAFDALVLSNASGKAPLFGKIIHGSEQITVRVNLTELMEAARTVVNRIAAQQASPTPPPLILNKHCAECEFKERCRQTAIEKDELTLLSGMTEKERKKEHSKGIFTVTQLSYTFRPRRKPKRLASKPEKYHRSLKALAIREKKIHIAGKPELNIKGTPVYLDVEGVPDRDFYYLIGLRIESGDSYVQHSFWANDRSEEKQIWSAFLQALEKIENPQLIHYGSYETVFLKRMKDRYPDIVDPIFLNRLIEESLNLLSVIYAQIYFPTYSNGLKEIAGFLGFQWTEKGTSGFDALIWRYGWELSREPDLKEKLVTYNVEDCDALEKVVNAVTQLCQRPLEAAAPQDNSIVHTESLKRESIYRLGKFVSSIPELQYINKAAYWDYQRERIYLRSSQRLKRISRRNAKGRAKAVPLNKIVECPPPPCCPQCKATTVTRYRRKSKIVRDLKFTRSGVKRWIVKYTYYRYSCLQCGATFLSEEQRAWTKGKYGPNVRSYLIYLIIELRVTQQLATQSLNDLFGFSLIGQGHNIVTHQKAVATQLYRSTYEGILKRIVAGKLIQADETRIKIKGKETYVWVFTSLEEVVYYYTETREGDFLQELLREFKEVLVSDFYAAYDSIGCPQQKCLIHLMRDLNDDLLKNPFDEELKVLVQEFATLLKPMVETIDRHGLKAHFLQKHKVFVERFYKGLSKRDCQSEIVVKYKKRFEKYQDKLFTFLDYDGVPWNNNNAEHAIKAFAKLRRKIGEASSEKGIREYLILLSICETCKYKGVGFLDFLRSGEKDIDVFVSKR